MKVLLTGAGGFIGSHLASRLVGDGFAVRAVDDFSTGRRENLERLEGKLELLEGDLAEFEVCREAVRGVELVWHQAAIPSVPRSLAEPLLTHRANVDATMHLLEASRQEGVRRVVYAASSSAYGDSDVLPKHEGMPARLLSPYAVHKYVGELYGRTYSELLGLEVVSLRYFNVFGPRQDPDSPYSAVIPKFIAMMQRGERPTIFGDGETSRDFTYVDNAVEANLLAMQAAGAGGRIYNVGTGRRISLNQLVQHLGRLLSVDLPPVYLPERPGDVRHSQADIRRAQAELGYRPPVAFEEGLRRTVEAMRGQWDE